VPAWTRDEGASTAGVTDETPAGDMAGALRSLIDRTVESAHHLKEGLAQIAEARDEARTASARLQERLRLSARMLKALQGQSDHVGTLLADLEDGRRGAERAAADLERLLGRLEARARAAVEHFEQRVDEAHRSTLQRYEGQIVLREQVLADLEAGLDDAKSRADALARLVESAEVNVAVLAHKSAQASKEAEIRANRSAEMVRRCDEAHQRLSQQLTEAVERIDLAAARSEESLGKWEARLRRGDSVARDLDRRRAQVPQGVNRAETRVARKAGSDGRSETVELKPRTKTQLFGDLAEATRLSRREVASVFSALAGLIKCDLGRDGPGVFTVPGLTRITKVRKPARPSHRRVGPSTGAEPLAEAPPPRIAVRIRPLKGLKELL
jgi:chromosome segregation ATPase